MADKLDKQDDGNRTPDDFNKEEHKREVNRRRSIKKQRKMKMAERSDDVVPSPGRTSLSVESIHNDPVSEPGAETDQLNYLNQLIGDAPEKPPTAVWSSVVAIVAILLAAIIAFYFKK